MGNALAQDAYGRPPDPSNMVAFLKISRKHKKWTGYEVLKQDFKIVYDIEAQETGKNAEKEEETVDDNEENSSFCTILVK